MQVVSMYIDFISICYNRSFVSKESVLVLVVQLRPGKAGFIPAGVLPRFRTETLTPGFLTLSPTDPHHKSLA